MSTGKKHLFISVQIIIVKDIHCVVYLEEKSNLRSGASLEFLEISIMLYLGRILPDLLKADISDHSFNMDAKFFQKLKVSFFEKFCAHA